MASKGLALTTLFLTFNLLFFTLVTSTHPTTTSCPPPPAPKPKCECPPSSVPKPPTPKSPTPKPPAPKPPTPKPPAPKSPAPKPPGAAPTPKSPTTCPKDALKLGVCANVLGGLIGLVVGTPPKEPCCSVLEGLADLEAAVCLCTAIKANILGINLNIPVDLSLLLNYCGKKVPTGFECS